MKLTESQKDFILSCLTTEITNKEILIKYWTDKAQKVSLASQGITRSVKIINSGSREGSLKHTMLAT